MKILVGVDGSVASVRASATLARLVAVQGAEVRLLHVLSFTLDPFTLLGEQLKDTPERLAIVEHAVSEATREPVEVLWAGGARVSVAHRFGNPADEILAEVEEWEPDLVVLGRRGLGIAERWLMGSVSERVSRHTRVPVLIVS